MYIKNRFYCSFKMIMLLVIWITSIVAQAKDAICKDHTLANRSTSFLTPCKKAFMPIHKLVTQAEQTMPEIAGTYTAAPADGETKACNLSVQISRLNGAYAYTFHMNSKVYKGKVKLEKGDNKGEVYVTFLGIEWAEYEGNEDEEKRPLKKPIGLSGLWSDNQITIQNTGNSMNYYVQIDGCDQKYISLIKQK